VFIPQQPVTIEYLIPNSHTKKALILSPEDFTRSNLERVVELLLESFAENARVKITKIGIRRFVLNTTSLVIFDGDYVIGYCALSIYSRREMTVFLGVKYYTFGLFWLCVDKDYRNQGLATELVNLASTFVEQIATLNRSKCILFGEFNPSSVPLISMLWSHEKRLIIGCNKYTPIGLELAKQYSIQWRRNNLTPCNTDKYGKLSNGREVIGLLFD
jgi:predicted N-acetyltransferase YhbS